MNIAIQGLDELRSTLAGLANRGIKKAAKAGISAGLQEIASALRSDVNSSKASGELKRAVRATIGKSLKSVNENYVGKVGIGVGSGAKGTKIARAMARHAKSGGGGVGISAQNVHWAVLGTEQRHTASGRNTGAMPAFFDGALPRAVESSGAQVTAAAAAKIQQVLASEAQKKG